MYHYCAADMTFLGTWMTGFQSFPLLTPNMECVRACSSPQRGLGWRWGGVRSRVRRKVGWCNLPTLWFSFSHPNQLHLPLCRPHSRTQQDLSATTAANVILINLTRIQMRQASVSLQQKTIPHVSQVNKMDLLLCWFSQNCSCDFSVFGSLLQNFCYW